MRPALYVLLALGRTGLSAIAPVDPGLFSTLARYAAFASASYSSNCRVPPFGTAVEKVIENKGTSTQATIFRDDVNREFILSWRGTSDVADFLTDLDQTLVPCVAAGLSCGDCKCHNGYLKQFNSVQADLAAALGAGTAARPGYSLVVTGHSMGGSLASIAAVALKGSAANLTTYTYGQPRTGNQAYADFVDSTFGGQGGTMFRVTHKNDGVPQIPAQTDGYRHHTTEYWQSVDPPAAATTFQCAGQEPTDCNQSVRGTGIGNGGVGINLAHLSYFGVSEGNPLNLNAACKGA
ncbi:Alpha/Beta hydrolase protein [Coniochaeta sp. 2T2.1]|nr:Alpha/Beta hydrolase protein [Coniochaeta sp. 2T2.1]